MSNELILHGSNGNGRYYRCQEGNPNMTHCGDCGSHISKRANTCPECGASTGALVKKVVKTALVAGAALFVLNALTRR